MATIDGLTPLEQAQETVLNATQILGCEKLGLLEVLGRVLGEDIIAPRANPPWDNSAMDGFAVRWEDIKQEHAITKIPELKIIEDVQAGQVATKSVGAGEAIRIMTGAPLPAGADTVVRVEFTEPSTDRVRIMKAEYGPNANVRPKGEDVEQGERIIAKGTPLRPAEIGMLAILAKSFVLVHQRPRVAILSTGDELADLDERFDENKIVNSNSYGIAAGVQEAGGIPVLLGIAKDDPDSLKGKNTPRTRLRYCGVIRRSLDGGLRLYQAGVRRNWGGNELLEVGHSSGSTGRVWENSRQAGVWLAWQSCVIHGHL